VWFGAAERPRNLVVITVSEGLGVGIYIDGQLLRGASGMAGEFGHIILDQQGPACGCGRQGCWEAYASNWATLRYYRRGQGEEEPSFLSLLSLAESGDGRALDSLSRMAHEIGRGMRPIIAALSPEEIVFVGEFTRLWSHMGAVIDAEVRESVLVGRAPRVRPATAEPRVARLRGTVALVLQKHFGERRARFA
jgi:predicted NBD/HSP70 family sugar kinase